MNDAPATEMMETQTAPDKRPLRRLQTGVSLGLLAVVLAVVFMQSDLAELSKAAGDVSAVSLALAFGCLVVGVMLAVVRLRVVAHDLGYGLSWRDTFSTLGVGHLGGALFFQIAGQLIARSAYLSRRGVPVGASVIIFGYERVLALGVSLALATLGAWHLFGRIALDLDNGGLPLVKLIAGMACAVVAGGWLGWGRLAKRQISERLGSKAYWRIARSTLLSLGIQLATASAYVIIAVPLAKDVQLTDLAAASLIVMLAASLPVSLAGWGVREFSAVLALGAVGVPLPAALLIAVLVGTGALVSVVPLAAMGMGGQNGAPRLAPRIQAPIDYNLLVSVAVPLIVATAVFFQVYLPTRSGGLNVNLADPFAILGGALFLAYCRFGPIGKPRWRLPYFNAHILAITFAITISLFIGAVTFGWTDWALFNKYSGWFVLLAYGATGALIVNALGQRGLDLLLRTFFAVGVSIAVIEILLLTVRGAGIALHPDILWMDPRGFSQNRNAFAFQMLMIVCAGLALALPRHLSTLLLSIGLAAIWATASRAGLGALFAVLVLAVYVKAISMTRLFIAVAAAAGIVVIVVLVKVISLTAGPEALSLSDPLAVLNKTRLNAMLPSADDRMASVMGAIELIRNYPIFGSGLGSFMNSELQAGRPPLVIHSTLLWIFAEMGLFGVVIFVAPALRIFWSEFRRDPPDTTSFLLILILCGLGVMSLVHEMLYQRTFWLLLGAALACPVSGSRADDGREGPLPNPP